jgi:hypothetical protein
MSGIVPAFSFLYFPLPFLYFPLPLPYLKTLLAKGGAYLRPQGCKDKLQTQLCCAEKR